MSLKEIKNELIENATILDVLVIDQSSGFVFTPTLKIVVDQHSKFIVKSYIEHNDFSDGEESV